MIHFFKISRIALAAAALGVAIWSGPAAAAAAPGQGFLDDCLQIERSNLSASEQVGSAVCLSSMQSMLSVHRQLSLAIAAENEKVMKSDNVDPAALRREPSPFCRVWSRDRAVSMLDATEDVRGLVKYLRGRPLGEFIEAGPGDDVRSRLISAYLVAEYPCDEYFRTFGWDAKAHRPKLP